jgi:Arc/MetJ-type ribon-helix-helix transcriptional regulator
MSKPRISCSISEELDEHIEELVENEEFGSKSDAIRYLLERGREADEIKERLETREDRIEQLEDQLARRSNIEDDLEEVAETVEDLPAKISRTESYSERRQRKLDQASLSQRIKWRFTGVPVDRDE